VAGAVSVFGSYGILIKSPKVQAANVDTIVFQVRDRVLDMPYESSC